MAGFAMCAACRAEYEDPADRRFHAQPNACPDCGPHALARPTPRRARIRSPPPRARCAARRPIVAVKGIGGFHLACRADDEDAVARLRARKHREDKPFALMAPSVEAARELVDAAAGGGGAAGLAASARSCSRPGARARRWRRRSRPRSPELGVMLPYSPLHHLLLADAGSRW